ncbi:MAG: hypothetical protein V4508_13370 [Pseudomonadota bacterium]
MIPALAAPRRLGYFGKLRTHSDFIKVRHSGRCGPAKRLVLPLPRERGARCAVAAFWMFIGAPA